MEELNSTFIEGSSGGGGTSGATFNEAENTLRALSIYKVLHLVSAGKIGGFPIIKQLGIRAPGYNTFVDDVPVKYIDDAGAAKWNTGENIKIEWRDGSPGQTVIDGFGETSVFYSVGQTVVPETPVVRSHGINVDAAIVIVGFPEGLFQQNSDGIVEIGVSYQIQTRTGTSGTWNTIHNVLVKGKQTSYTEINYRVKNPNPGNVWQTRIVRMTNDVMSSVVIKNAISYAGYNELKFNASNYENDALVAIAADGKSFNSGNVPTQTFLIDGIICQVPNTYTPGYYDGDLNFINPSYSGTWDGVSFINKVCSNPVWVIYYLLTNSVNGLGDVISPSNIDVYQFYSAAQYCDELITVSVDGVNKTVPRFIFNWQFTEYQNAIDLLMAVASSFNARLIYSGGYIGLIVDKPTSATRIINKSSVKDAKFEWYTTPKGSRFTAVSATFYNRFNNYQPETITITADEYLGATADGGGSYITNLGYNESSVICIGAVEKQQAVRNARYVLEASLKQTTYVKFTMPMSAMDIKPGEVFYIDDSTFSGFSDSGRVVAIGSNYVDLDRPITISNNTSIRFSNTSGVVMKTTSAAATNSTRIYLKSITNIAIHSEWAANSMPQVRVINITEDDLEYQIECKLYDSTSFTRVDTGVSMSVIDTFKTKNFGVAEKPSNINVKLDTVNINGLIQRKGIISWGGNLDYVKSWQISYSLNGGARVYDAVNQPSFTIDPLPPGYIEIWVSAVSIGGLVSDFSYTKWTMPATEASGSILLAPTNVSVNGTGGTNFTTKDLVITWDNPSGNSVNQILDSKVVIKNGATVLRTVYVPYVNSRSQYIYSFDMNVSDGGPYRTITAEVQFRDTGYKLSAIG